MRFTYVGAVAALAIGSLGLPVPAAARDGSDVSIDSGNAYPGSTVRVSTSACDPDADYGKGWSEMGGEFHLFQGDEEGVLAGEFQIPEEASPGNDTITLKCPPLTKVTETYRVIGRPPRGSVDAGFGPPEDTGTGRALSGGLLLAAAAGAVVWLRRRPNDDRA